MLLCNFKQRPGAKGREADLFCLVKKIMANEIRRKNSFLSGKLSSAYLKPEFGDERGLSDSKSERMAEGHSRVKSDLGWSLRGSVAGSSSIPAKPPISNGEQVGFDLKFPVTYGVFPTLGRFDFESASLYRPIDQAVGEVQLPTSPKFSIKAWRLGYLLSFDTARSGWRRYAFNGAFAVSLMRGASTLDSARFAAAPAALSVTRRGAQPSLADEPEVFSFLGSRAQVDATASCCLSPTRPMETTFLSNLRYRVG